MKTSTIDRFGGLDLASDPQEAGAYAIDLLNVETDELPQRVRVRDGYAKVTSSAGASRYDSIFSVSSAVAVASSVKFPGTAADDSAAGSVAWTSIANITATDFAVANAALNVPGDISHYAKATNFGFAIPGTATITGVLVEVVRTASGLGVYDKTVKLVKGGVVSGNNNGALAQEWSTFTTVGYGSSSDLWGLTLTPADVNGATFGVVVSATSTTPASARLDSVKITVYYQPLANVAVAGAAGSRLDVIDTSGAVAATVATAADTLSTYAAFGSPSTSATYIANSGTTIRKLVASTFSTPAGMPVAKYVALQTPDNRLVAANIGTIPTGAASTASTSLVHFSGAGTPETWGANDYVYLTPGDNEDIQGIAASGDKVFVFKSTKFFVFWGNSTAGTGSSVFNFHTYVGNGMAAPLAVASAPNGVYFLDRRGIYFTNGGPAVRVSDAVAQIFTGGLNDSFTSSRINPSAFAQISMCWYSDRLYVGVPLGSTTTNSHTLVLDPQTGSWTLWDVPMGGMAATAAQPSTLLFTYGQGSNDVGRYIYRGAYTDDAGTAITSRYRTSFFDLGTPDVEKRVRSMSFVGTGSVGVKAAVNDSATLGTSTTVALGTGSSVDRGYYNGPGLARNFSFEVSGTSAWSLSRISAKVAGERGAR
jgi:hypothetical protein